MDTDLSKRVMSDAELRHRRKLQGNIARTTSSLGLTGLGITGAALAARKSPGALKAMQKVPKVGAKLGKTPEEASGKLKQAAINTGIVSGGIGGVGGFNQASIYSDESKRRKMTKGLTEDAGVYGEVGKAKDWQPNASKFDAERSRMKRSQAYEDVGGPAAGALAAGAGYKGAKAGKLLLANRKVKFSPAKNLPNVQGKMAARTAKAVSHGKTAAALGAGSAAVAAGTLAVRNRNRSKSWAPYSKRSAFGVEHDPVAKRGKWTKQDTKNVTALGVGGAAGGVVGRRMTAGSRVGTAAGAGLGVMGGAAIAGRKHAKAYRRSKKG